MPQTINLLDDTIKNNICFGVNEKEIDLDRLNEVIEISGIKDFINNQEKLDTIIGHAGAKFQEANYKE